MTARRINELLRAAGPTIRKRFLSVMSRVKDRRTLNEMEAALEQGRISEVLDDIEAAAAALAGTVEAVHVDVAKEVSDVLSTNLDALVTYNTTSPITVDQLRTNRARMVTEITNEQRAVIADVISEGSSRGDNPRTQAIAIRDSIGLTSQQAEWVRSYRRRLETLDPAALGMELRDGRHDGQTQRAIDAGKPLAPEQIDRMVDRYTARAIKYRAEVIGRTEALAAVHQGMEAGYQQAVDNGTLPAEQLECKWITGPRARDWHASMDGQTRPWGEPFTSGHGVDIMHPGEAGLPADEVCQCNCARTVRVLPARESKPLESGQSVDAATIAAPDVPAPEPVGARAFAPASSPDFGAVVDEALARAPKALGERKVFISDLAKDPEFAGMSLDDLKRKLMAAHTAGTVTLSQANLTGAFDVDKLRESTIYSPVLDTWFHLLLRKP